MNPLKDHEAVKEMLRLMEENDQQEQAAEFARLIDAVDNMSQQYAKLANELTEVKERLSEASRLRHPLYDILSKTVRTVETKADNAFTQFSRTNGKALAAVARLEDAADRNRGKREKSSVRRRLEKKLPALPAPAKKSHEAER